VTEEPLDMETLDTALIMACCALAKAHSVIQRAIAGKPPLDPDELETYFSYVEELATLLGAAGYRASALLQELADADSIQEWHKEKHV
jgi:hypothetical protein